MPALASTLKFPYFSGDGPIMPTGLELNRIVKWLNAQSFAIAGTSIVDFGAFLAPSSAKGALRAEASLTVTGQSTITATSVIEASLQVLASTDHTADEHRVENIKVRAGSIVPGVGFTLYLECTLGGTWGKWNVGWSYQ